MKGDETTRTPPGQTIRVVSGEGKEGRKEETFICSHYQTTYYKDSITVELMPQNRMVTLPDDADVVYIMSPVNGDTVQTIRFKPAKV